MKIYLLVIMLAALTPNNRNILANSHSQYNHSNTADYLFAKWDLSTMSYKIFDESGNIVQESADQPVAGQLTMQFDLRKTKL